jgi:hypothetical protein
VTKYATKAASVFFSPSDEIRLEIELRRTIPAIRFVDGSLWEGVSPPIGESLSACRSAIVFLWDKDACPSLPHQVLPDGRVRGPTSGVVVQYVRPILKDGVLASGHLAIGYEKSNTAISMLFQRVWKILRGLNAGSLMSVDRDLGVVLQRQIKNYIVGPGAIDSAAAGVILKHCAADVYYRCE